MSLRSQRIFFKKIEKFYDTVKTSLNRYWYLVLKHVAHWKVSALASFSPARWYFIALIIPSKNVPFNSNMLLSCSVMHLICRWFSSQDVLLHVHLLQSSFDVHCITVSISLFFKTTEKNRFASHCSLLSCAELRVREAEFDLRLE